MDETRVEKLVDKLLKAGGLGAALETKWALKWAIRLESWMGMMKAMPLATVWAYATATRLEYVLVSTRDASLAAPSGRTTDVRWDVVMEFAMALPLEVASVEH